LNLTFEENLKNQHAKEVRKILGLKQYEKIELVYRNDKHLIINNTRREILKK
jgi:antitoxin component of MazEF toxin-antitoxin module